jgi:hypothetical protein
VNLTWGSLRTSTISLSENPLLLVEASSNSAADLRFCSN